MIEFRPSGSATAAWSTRPGEMTGGEEDGFSAL
jgi:hypothetical protein